LLQEGKINEDFPKKGVTALSFPIVPEWTNAGILPPNDPINPTNRERSPYKLEAGHFVQRFGTSPQRQKIVKGLLAFRHYLYGIGIIKGFQWLDGSFVENIEQIEQRNPKDIDVVTFFELPKGFRSQEDFLEKHSKILDRSWLKNSFSVDSFCVQIDSPHRYNLIENATYWYSVWSHRRSGQWKGFLEIPLSPEKDESVCNNLLSIDCERRNVS